MASIIRVKRSTGTTAPGSLQFGELGLTIGTGTQANKGERLFVGDNSGNVDVVGGRYFTDLMVHAPGTVASVTNPTTAANGFVAILDQNRKVDLWNVDNLTLDANTLSSTNGNGDIIFNPNGSGEVMIPDDTFLGFGGGANGTDAADAKIEYDENGTDQLTFTGADVRINITTQSNSKDTGALIVEGGVGIEKNLNVGGNLAITGIVTFSDHIRLPDTKELRLGDSNDLKLVHDGTDSNITNATNDLNITNTGDDINITAADDIVLKVQGSEDAITAIGDGAVNLFFNGVNKAQTRIDGFNGDGTLETKNFVVVGVSTITGKVFNTGGIEIDNIGISSNRIETRAGGGNQIFIDPFPSGLSNEGDVIIKGNLQVDGTTTTVNSTNVSVNDPIMRVGDVTSVRTVMSPVSSGANTIVVDSVTGLQTDDVVTATGIPGNTTISSINTGTKTLTISNNTSAGITTSTQLTITHAKDTNTDRGISFNYNTSSGTANNKLGFFGMDDSQVGANGSRVWTYVPDATNTAEVISGTKGYLDIKGIYYQSGDFSTHGVVYFDSTGLQNSTTAPSAATITSTQLLTAVTEIAITLPSSQSVTEGDLVTQAGGGSQQGVVKTTSNSTTVTLIGVTGTFNTSADLILNGTGTGKTPSNVSTTYTSKPMWTTTIDGGTF